MKRKGDEPATKRDFWAQDVQALAHEVHALGQRLDQRMDTFEAVMRRMAAAQVRSQAKTDEKIDDLKTSMRGLFSQQGERMETFMGKSLKVEKDQFYLIRRMDKVEDRVARLERRA